MDLLTIGAFSRASRLSPKALRLYDELGLLPPVRTDPATGYRYYHPDQLARARLVAWLRRLGMPLARIRDVCALQARDPAAAAEAVRTYWEQVEADTAARRDLAAFLVDRLEGEAPTMPDAMLELRYAALTDTGRLRKNNQDAVYAGERLLAVADGFGAGGARASSAAIDALRRIDATGTPAGALLNLLEDAAEQARRAVHGATAGSSGEPAPDPAAAGAAGGSGTTLTAMLWTGSRLALVHIGDSRAYVLRDGDFFQITHDHTLVRQMVEDGRISEEEAATHPQRALLLRALGGDGPNAPHSPAPGPASGPGPTAGTGPASRPAGAGPAAARAVPSADTELHEARPHDRYLLCSKGISAVLPPEEIRRTAESAAHPEQAVRKLLRAAHRHGAPDNASCVVGDVHRLALP